MQCKLGDKLRQQRDGKLGAGLLAVHAEAPALDALVAHPDDIAAGMPGLQEHFQRKPRLGTGRMTLAVGVDFVIRPCVDVNSRADSAS